MVCIIHAPAATTALGSGIALYISRSGCSVCFVTGPVTTRTSASLGFHVAAKAPVFSFSKIGLAEIALGPEMKSTGEVMGIGKTYSEALYKAVNGANMRIPAGGTILMTVADRDKEESAALAKGFMDLGYHIMATEGTGKFFQEKGINVEIVNKLHAALKECS